jgi:CRISPR-associated protein Cas2
MYVLIAYDVEARRTRHYHKLLSRYLVQEQNSVFGGDMTEATLLRLHRDLTKLAREGDRVFQVLAENRHNVSVSLLCKSDANATLQQRPHDHHRTGTMVM